MDRDAFSDMYGLHLNARNVVYRFEFVLQLDDEDVGERFKNFSADEIFFHFITVDGVFKFAYVGFPNER